MPHPHSITADPLHPDQLALGPGDTWVRFVNLPNREVQWGRILTTTEVFDAATELGSTREQAEAAVDQAYRWLLAGYALSQINDDNGADLRGVYFKAHIWPIDPSCYAEAQAVDWHYDSLPTTTKIRLQQAFFAMRSRFRVGAR